MKTITHSHLLTVRHAARRGLAGWLWSVALSALLATWIVAGSGWLGAAQQAQPQPAASPSEAQPTYQIQVKSNAVVVRVVVHDAHGQPIDGLTQKDFQLFDDGKPQTISQFSVEHPALAGEKANPAATEKEAQAPESNPTFTAPQRFVALYFDDARTSFADLAHVREAALRFLANGIRPEDRLAVVTTSGFVNQDYTSDVTKLAAAINKLQARPNTGDPRDECPNMSDYQADLIVNHEDADATAMAVNEAINKGCVPSKPGGGVAASNFESGITQLVMAKAWQVFDYYDLQAHTSLYTLQDMIRRVARLPGQREIVLVTPGFMSLNFQSMLEDAADLALRSNVVIGALDPRGLLTLMHISDAGEQQFTIDNPADPRLEVGVRLQYEQVRDWAAWSVPQELAWATGGQAIHNTNDLLAGLTSVSAPPGVYYTLAFAPSDLKPNGKFHTLHVKLTEKRGLMVDARHGYFAPRQALSAQQVVDEQIKDAAYSEGVTMDLPVELKTQFYKSQDGQAHLTLLARVDARRLDFRKDGANDTNHLRFVAVVFDVNGNYVAGQQKDLDVIVSEANIAELRAKGLTMRTDFTLVPGTYMIRQVVRDSEGGHLSAMTKNVELP
jgi:VWFA-related protein